MLTLVYFLSLSLSMISRASTERFPQLVLRLFSVASASVSSSSATSISEDALGVVGMFSSSIFACSWETFLNVGFRVCVILCSIVVCLVSELKVYALCGRVCDGL